MQAVSLGVSGAPSCAPGDSWTGLDSFDRIVFGTGQFNHSVQLKPPLPSVLAASKQYGKDSEVDLESLNECLHKYMTQMPSLIDRVKSWTKSDQDPASLLMTVAMRCQRILGKNVPRQEQQWPKLHAVVNAATIRSGGE